MITQPDRHFRYAFKRGMSGWDVQALQIALNSHQKTFPITEDGIFGPQTEECIKREQANHHLTVDGIIGPITQSIICSVECRAADKLQRCAPGLSISIVLAESSAFFACVSGPNGNGSFDAGVTQDNLTSAELMMAAKWHYAFTLSGSISDMAAKMRRQKDIFAGRPAVNTNKYAWELAALYHNWESAAENMSYGYGPYKEAARNDRTEDWIVTATDGRLSTPNQWAAEQIRTKTMYVTEWIA